MSRKVLLMTLTVVILLSTLTLGACTKSDSDMIKDVVKSFINAWNRQDFEKCLELYSSEAGYTSADIEYMRDSWEETGKLTIEEMAEPVITGSTAWSTVELESQNLGISQTADIPLVKENGDWKMTE